MNTFPKILYKYRDWQNDLHKRIITENEIFFSSPLHFNDPFDCKIPLRYDLLTKKDWEEKLIFHIKDQHPKWTEQEISKETERWLNESYSITDGTYVKEHMSDELRQLEKTYGIFSLSANCNNILMWSHYSNCHSGFCVGFDSSRLLKNVRQYSRMENLFFELLKINYQEEYPIIIPNKFDSDNFYIDRLLYKSKFWEYEQEYRILSYFTGSDAHYAIDDDCYKQFILGKNMNEKDKIYFTNTVTKKYKNIEIFDSTVSKTNFSLELVQIY